MTDAPNQTTLERWGPDACQRCGYNQSECACVGGYVAPQFTEASALVARFRAEADHDVAFEAAMRLVNETLSELTRLRALVRSLGGNPDAR